MPPLPDVPGVLKLTLNWGVEGDSVAQSILHFAFTGGASAADLSTLANTAVSTGESEFAALTSDSSGMLSATARDLSSAMGNEATAGTPWVGTRGAALLSPATSAVVSHSISRHYRGGHPRTYLPLGVSGDVAATGLWADAFVALVDAAWGDYIAIISDDTYGALNVGGFVSVSYFGPPNRLITGSTGRVRTVSTVRGAPIVDAITGHITRKMIGSQRRRNRDA